MHGAPFTYARYRFILRTALDAGYRFAGFHELRAVRETDALICLLRHDCDTDMVAALRMARIEAEFGVRSTYFVMLRSAIYNLMAPTNAALVRKILALGHRLGLHFDENLHADCPDNAIASLVDRERDWLAKEFGQAIVAISFHNPSRRILDNKVRLECINTYDRADMAGVHYMSDSNLNFREGCPSRLFAARSPTRIQLLVHPEWWTETEMPVQEKWNRMLADNFELIQQHLLTGAGTYSERQGIMFASVNED